MGLIQLLSLQNTLRNINQLVSVSKEHFDELYLPALINFAESAQLAPASRAHHHSGPGGLLVHTLNVIVNALRIRKQYMLPQNADPETISQEEHAWTYGVFCAALLHDAGKLVANVAFNVDGKPWTAHSGPLTLIWLRHLSY